MASTFEYIINLKTQGALKGLNTFSASVSKVTNKFQNLQDTAFRFANIGDAFQDASDQLNRIVEPGIAFESQLKDLQAITGVTDSELHFTSNWIETLYLSEIYKKGNVSHYC